MYILLILKTVFILGMINFPFVKIIKKGTVDVNLTNGFLLGTNYNKENYVVVTEDEEKHNMALHVFKFHFFIITITMLFGEKE